MDELPGLIGDVKEDVIVDTTIDKSLEKKAEQSLVDILDKEGGSGSIPCVLLLSGQTC